MYMLLDIIGWLAVTTAIFYSILLWKWSVVWRSSSAFSSIKKTHQNKSIIIPFRNDVDLLKRLLDQLHHQLKDVEGVEVLAINDHSNGEVALGEVGSWKKLMVIQNNGEGKKSALRTGIERAQFDSIITLDADVILADDWWSRMSAVETQEDEMVVFPIGLRSGFRWEQIEWSYLHGITGGSAMAGRAIMANGSHVNFSKKIYKNHLPNEHSVSSGDDMFLLERTKQTGTVSYIYFSSPICYVDGNKSLIEFIHQRVRWAGKSVRLRDRDIILFGAFSFLSTILYLLVVVGVFFDRKMWLFLLLVIGLKWLSERYFSASYKVLKMPKAGIVSSLIFSVFYPLYTIFVALLAMIYRPKWKGRPVKI